MRMLCPAALSWLEVLLGWPTWDVKHISNDSHELPGVI